MTYQEIKIGKDDEGKKKSLATRLEKRSYCPGEENHTLCLTWENMVESLIFIRTFFRMARGEGKEGKIREGEVVR